MTFPEDQLKPVQTNQAMEFNQGTITLQQIMQATQTSEILSTDEVKTREGISLFFNPSLKISHKQKKVLTCKIFENTGMKIVGEDQTFEYPEQLITNISNQSEMLVAMYWNSEEFWRTGGARGNYWETRPAESMEADIVEFMFEQVQNRVDPLKSKALKEKANKANE